MNLLWVRKGLKDFVIILFVGIAFMLLCSLVILILISAGMSPAYSSMIISLCLLFVGSMMFAYYEHRHESLQKKKEETINQIIKDAKEKAGKTK